MTEFVKADDLIVETFKAGDDWTVQVSCRQCGWYQRTESGGQETFDEALRRLINLHLTHDAFGLTAEEFRKIYPKPEAQMNSTAPIPSPGYLTFSPTTFVLCPKCLGQKLQSKPPWVAHDQTSWVSTETGPYPCVLCEGTGLVSKP